ncbi:hypothetical protein BCR36DRAFT_410236 [Piromyces finnis]|uniref:Uncharacterized protein n=1 Tax=Piromyces finnis TaxID=1754191 RepID=A0A1Y1VG19_9FUNG|nr:hypothetical protein BCR36DRAFT_410236 [Piromyces finnis]|eukprot:ORX55299.1 hypothetical protein BCR36DRAFT_410236 [Piromyces finnis]
MLGNCPTGSRIAFFIPKYEYRKNENSQNKSKIQNNEWIKTCKYFIECNDKLRQEDNSPPLLVNKEYMNNFLNNSIEGNNTNIVLYGERKEDFTTDINECFHIQTVTSIITKIYKSINDLASKLENENKKNISLSIKYYTLISENEVMDLLNDNLDENYRIINIRKKEKDINESFTSTSEIYERKWNDKITNLDVMNLSDILNAFYKGYQHFQTSKLIKSIKDKSINIPKLIFSLIVKTAYKPIEKTLVRKYEPLTVLNIIDFTTIQTNMKHKDGCSTDVKTILNIITGLKNNLFYTPYLNPPYWSQIQYSPRNCQNLIVLFSHESAESLDTELNDLFLSLNILSDPKNNNKSQDLKIPDNSNKNKSNDDNAKTSNNDDSSNNNSNIETLNNSNNITNSINNNKKSYIKNKTPEQIDALINIYQKQIKEYLDKDISKTNYIEKIENELENCKKMLNSYSISDSFLRKKFIEMNNNMKMYKEKIDELNQIVNEKEYQLLEKQESQQKNNEKEEEKYTKMKKDDITGDILLEENSRLDEIIKSKNEDLDLLKKEIQFYKNNEIRYIELLENIELIKSFKSNEYECNKDIIEYYITNLKIKIDDITQNLKSINITDSKAEDNNIESISNNKNSDIIEQSQIINDNPISYEINRLNEILKEKEKENCLLKDKVKKLENASMSTEKERDEIITENTQKLTSNSIEDDIYTIQINRIRELEKTLHDVTCERDNNMSRISDLEFSLMKAQTLLLSNNLNKKEEEKLNNNNKNLDSNKNLSITNANENNDINNIANQNTSFYLSEFSSFIPPSPPSISAYSPSTSASSITSEESEPLYLTENVFQNLKKYKSKKGSKSNKVHENSNDENYNNYTYDNNFKTDKFSSSMYDENEAYYNTNIDKPKYNKHNNRNTLYICDGLDNLFNNIENKKMKQQITEKPSSLCLDVPRKRNFDKEHRRANSIDCFNIKSNKYSNKQNLNLLHKNKSCSFTNYENIKEFKKEDNATIKKNETNTYDDDEKLINEYSSNNDTHLSNNDKRDTYIKVPQMVVEYDRSRITIRNEEIEKLVPLKYILQEKKAHHHSIKNSYQACSSPSSYTFENLSVVSSSSKSRNPTKTTTNTGDKTKSLNISSNSKIRRLKPDDPKVYENQSFNTSIRSEPYQSLVCDKNYNDENERNGSNTTKEEKLINDIEHGVSHRNVSMDDLKFNDTNKINNVKSNNSINCNYNTYENYINYNYYSNYSIDYYNDDNYSRDYSDEIEEVNNKSESSVSVNEYNNNSNTSINYNINSNTVATTVKECQNYKNSNNSIILNKEVLNELEMCNSQEMITTSTSSFSSDDDDNGITSDETISTTYSNVSDNEPYLEEDRDEFYESNNEEKDEKREYPSYIIKQANSSKFLYNEQHEIYNMNQYDLTYSSDSRKSIANSKKSHEKKSNYINSTHNTIKSPRQDNNYYISNYNYKSNNNLTNENSIKNNTHENYINNPKYNYSNTSKQKDVIKKRKIPLEKNNNNNNNNNNNKTNENLINLNQLTYGKLQNNSQKLSKDYNNNTDSQINNGIYHSTMHDTNEQPVINNFNPYNNNKENFNNSNFNHSIKETSKSKNKQKEKEDTKNIYKLSHRISRIFSSKKNNSTKRLSHISIDTLQSERNNSHSNFFTPSFFHNENKRNSLTILDTSRINDFNSNTFNSVEKEKYPIPTKKSHKHIKNSISKK